MTAVSEQVTAADFRRAMGHFATGVTVVTSMCRYLSRTAGTAARSCAWVM